MAYEACTTGWADRPITDACDECNHFLLAHTVDRVCTMCALEARQVEIEQRMIEAVGGLRADWEVWLSKNDHLIPRLIGSGRATLIETPPGMQRSDAGQDIFAFPAEPRQLHQAGDGPLYSPNGPQTGLAPPLGLTSLLDRALEAVPQDARPRRPEEIAG